MTVVESSSTQLLRRIDWAVVFAVPEKLQHPRWTGSDVTKGEGENRIQIVLSDSKLSSWGKHVHVPEAWTRRERNNGAATTVVAGAFGLLNTALMAGTFTGAIFCWGAGWRKPYASGFFWYSLAMQQAVVVCAILVSWPSIRHSFLTAQPVSSQTSTQFFAQALSAFFSVLAASLQISLAITLRPTSQAPAENTGILRQAQPGVVAGVANMALYKLLEPTQ